MDYEYKQLREICVEMYEDSHYNVLDKDYIVNKFYRELSDILINYYQNHYSIAYANTSDISDVEADKLHNVLADLLCEFVVKYFMIDTKYAMCELKSVMFENETVQLQENIHVIINDECDTYHGKNHKSS